jgi:hypothetical protein
MGRRLLDLMRDRAPGDMPSPMEFREAFDADFKAGEVSMWDKIKAWFKHSVTILWARVVALVGLLLASCQSLLSDPNITGAIQTALQPQFIPYYVIAIGLVTEIARRRTAGRA